MDVTVATFNLNNLFGRWNLYVEVSETRARDPGSEAPAAVEPPRAWLDEAPGLAATRAAGTRDAEPPDVQIVLEGDLVAGQIKCETIEALEEFIDEERLDEYRHLVLIEGNDERLIDVALMSKLPIGAVTSWRDRTYKNRPRERPIFSRDLLEA